MEAQTTSAKKSTSKDVQTIITDQFIFQLEKGIVPWRTLWMEAGVPTSLISKRAFKGINVLLLAPLRYEHNVFLTGKQLETLGGTVKKDEKPHMIVFWSTPQGDAGAEKKPALRYYLVYNVAQCDGIPGEAAIEVFLETNPIKACEGLVANILNGPSVRHKEAGAFYDPLEDYINMPKLKSFANPACYYSQFFQSQFTNEMNMQCRPCPFWNGPVPLLSGSRNIVPFPK